MKKFANKGGAARGARDDRPPRKPFRRDEAGGATRTRPPGPPREAYGDPYQRVQRPKRARGEDSHARGFTVTLDPDVARVFRGDASVNKALRLVIQLMEVAAPRPRMGGERGYAERPRRPGGYQGGAEARGFVRKPRFDESEE
ncbi:hypothetical protein FBR04_09160 [Betaproteobacteria bacterium PRO7]|jgi:hypothetical protein|nr:hypothetical protein [Betaproteobacteria bacterium PRO7]GIL05654.1 MAG: hypothetical protein BroJett031_21740 [Betaproteobacteria bacterium]